MKIVTEASRSEAVLDCIYTNFSELYSVPSIQPAIGLSDHRVVVCESRPCIKPHEPPVKYEWSRSMGQNERTFFAHALIAQNWTQLYHITSCEGNVKHFYTVIDDLLNEHCPWKSVRRCKNDKPWVTDHFRDLVKRKTKVFHKFGESSVAYKSLLNKVNRLSKTLKARFNESEVEKLCKDDNRQWWKAVNQLGGVQCEDNSITTLANQLTLGDLKG